MLWKDSEGVKGWVGWHGRGLERGTFWYKSSHSDLHICIFWVFLGGSVCVFKRQEEGAFVSLQYKRLTTHQDASATSGDCHAGGTVLSGERGFFSL